MTAKTIAGRFGVTGWVRNEADGSVMLEVQGSTVEVEGFLTALSDCMVDNIDSCHRTLVAAISPEDGFVVRR